MEKGDNVIVYNLFCLTSKPDEFIPLFNYIVKERGLCLIVCDMKRTINKLNISEFCQDFSEAYSKVATIPFYIKSFQTKEGLNLKKEKGEEIGGTKSLWGKNLGVTDLIKYRKKVCSNAARVSAKKKKEKAKLNENNIKFWNTIIKLKESKNFNWNEASKFLNEKGLKTSTNKDFTFNRARAMYRNCEKLYSSNSDKD